VGSECGDEEDRSCGISTERRVKEEGGKIGREPPGLPERVAKETDERVRLLGFGSGFR